MMDFSFNNLPQVSGINLEMLGLVERDQPGVLEQQRKKAGYAILAVFFDSLRRYRKMKGRVRLYFIQHYISDGRLIRIKGKDSTWQYVPLVKQPDTATYDVIVDDAPMSPNQKEMTWQMMQSMMPMLAKLNVPTEVWQIMLEYSPLPSSVSSKINQALTQAAQQPPEPDPEMVKIQAQTQAKQAELQGKAESDQRKAALDQQKAEGEFQLEREKMANELEVEKTKLAVQVEKTRQELVAMQQKHNMELIGHREKLAAQSQEHYQSLAFEERKHAMTMEHAEREQQRKDAESAAAVKTEKAQASAVSAQAKRRVKISRDGAGRMSEITEH